MNTLAVKAYELREHTVDIIMAGGGGHIGGDMSVMEVLVSLYPLHHEQGPLHGGLLRGPLRQGIPRL